MSACLPDSLVKRDKNNIFINFYKLCLPAIPILLYLPLGELTCQLAVLSLATYIALVKKYVRMGARNILNLPPKKAQHTSASVCLSLFHSNVSLGIFCLSISQNYAVFFFFRGFRCGPKEVKYSVEIQMIYLEQSLKYTLSELI